MGTQAFFQIPRQCICESCCLQQILVDDGIVPTLDLSQRGHTAYI